MTADRDPRWCMGVRAASEREESSPASTATAHASHTRTRFVFGLEGSTRRSLEHTSQNTPPHLWMGGGWLGWAQQTHNQSA